MVRQKGKNGWTCEFYEDSAVFTATEPYKVHEPYRGKGGEPVRSCIVENMLFKLKCVPTYDVYDTVGNVRYRSVIRKRSNNERKAPIK